MRDSTIHKIAMIALVVGGICALFGTMEFVKSDTVVVTGQLVKAECREIGEYSLGWECDLVVSTKSFGEILVSTRCDSYFRPPDDRVYVCITGIKGGLSGKVRGWRVIRTNNFK